MINITLWKEHVVTDHPVDNIKYVGMLKCGMHYILLLTHLFCAKIFKPSTKMIVV